MSTNTAATTIRLSVQQRARLWQAAAFIPSVANANRVQWGIPLLFVGGPGIAKTSVARQVASASHAPLEVFSPGERGEGAIGTIPVPSADGRYLDTPLPRWAEPFVAADGYGFVLLDEITTADPRMQAGLMAFVLERSIGGRPLGHRVRAFAACNPPDMTPGGTDLSPPLANRFVHLPWTPPTPEEWTEHMMGLLDPETETGALEGLYNLRSGDDALDLEAHVMREWPAVFAKKVSGCAAYLRANPGSLYAFPGVDVPGAGNAWQSPRSWDMLARVLTGAEIHKLDEDSAVVLAAGCIGAPAARMLFTYLRELDLPNPADILHERIQWTHKGERLDRTYAVLRGLTAYVTSLPRATPQEMTAALPRIKCFWRIINRVAESTPDLAYVPIQKALGAGLHVDLKTKDQELFALSGPAVSRISAAKVKYEAPPFARRPGR